MATAWSIQYLLLSFTESTAPRAAIRILCKCTLFWMKYLDLLLVNKRGSVDAAAGTFFMGRRLAEVLAPQRVAALAQEAQAQPAQEQPAPSPAGEPQPAQQPLAPVQVPQYQGLIQSDVRAYR